MWRMKFVSNRSIWKCATEPAFDVGRSAASPMAKMLSWAFDSRVCRSTGT